MAGPRFDPSVAADLARRVGDAAYDATDYGEAAAHYRRALEALDLVPGADERARLEQSIRLGASLMLIGDAAAGLPMLRAVARVAREHGEAVILAQAVCSMVPMPGGSTTTTRRDYLFSSMAEVAIQTLPANEEAWRIRVRALLGMHLWLTEASTQGAEMIKAAVAAARRLGDPVTLGQTLLPFRFSLSTLDMDERLACGRELVELGDRGRIEVFACVGRQQLAWCYRELGDRDEMDRWDRAAAERVYGPDIEQLGHAGAVAIVEGDLERAERLTDEVAAVWHSSVLGRLYAWNLRVGIDDCRGRTRYLDDVERGLSSGETAFSDVLESLLARGWARTARTSRARELLVRARQRGFRPMYVSRGGAWPISCWAETAALVGDTAAAEELGALIEPLAGRLVDAGVIVWDTVDRVRALLRLASGDAASAVDLAAGAVEASRRRRTPVLLARELIVLAAAQTRLAIDGTDDAVEEALAISRRTGARIIAHDTRLLLTAGATRAADPYGLTSREREILDLVAEGATNAQVAATLGISPATVRKHLENAYSKLNVGTRAAAIARTTYGRTSRPATG